MMIHWTTTVPRTYAPPWFARVDRRRLAPSTQGSDDGSDDRRWHRRIRDRLEGGRLRDGHGGALWREARDRERLQAGVRGPHPQGAGRRTAGDPVVDQSERGRRKDPARGRGE